MRVSELKLLVVRSRICVTITTSTSFISRGSNQVGQISKAPSAAFLLQFPMNLDVKMKALLLGAAFLIDAVEQATDFCNVLATLSGEEEGQRNWLMQMQGNARQG